MAHRGASGRAISFYSMPWPAPCSGALPTWYTIEVAALLAFIEEAAIQDAPPANTEARDPPATCLHAKTRLARGRQLEFGTYDALTSCIPGILQDGIPLLRNAQFFMRGRQWKNAPGRVCPVRRQYVLVERTV